MSTAKETIIDLFELDKLPPEKATEMVNRLGKLVFQAVLVRILPTLSESDLDEYEKIVDIEDGGAKIFSFLTEKVPDFDKIITEEAEILRKDLAGEFASAGI